MYWALAPKSPNCLYSLFISCFAVEIFVMLHEKYVFKGIVSRDFEGLQMILMNRTWVPYVPLKVYSYFKLHLHTVFLFKSFERVKLLLKH